jgi:large subunit ribosomal protein L25
MDLSVQTREMAGKKVNALRKEGLIPAELYGHGVTNVHFVVPVKEFVKVFREAGENTVVTLVAGKIKTPVMIHDVQHDYLTGEATHIDFYQVKMDEKITAGIPLEFVGESPAVREKAAVINKSMTELEVEAFPQDMPRRFEVNLALLDDIDKTIYVRDIVVPKGVVVLVDADTAIATATPPMKEEVVEPVATADVAEVKVESEEKVAARAVGKEEEKK